MPKERLDLLLTQRGLAESREAAQRLIRAGHVKVAGHVADKPGHDIDIQAAIEVTAPPRFVSRGGDKLEAAFLSFGLDVEGKTCLDVGASTGGFTDCLLQHGAARVYAVDVGKGQLHWKLRNDPRVLVMEEQNARYMTAKSLPESVTFACVDVSFISLTKILPAVREVLVNGGTLVTLIKPQFEAGREHVKKGGVVRDESVRAAVIEQIKTAAQDCGFEYEGICTSPLKGPAGNVEYLACFRRTETDRMEKL